LIATREIGEFYQREKAQKLIKQARRSGNLAA